MQVEGVLQEQFVDGGARGVGGTAGGDGFFTEALRVYVVEAAGEQHALRGREETRDAILPPGAAGPEWGRSPAECSAAR